jgi:hypothetical protein
MLTGTNTKALTISGKAQPRHPRAHTQSPSRVHAVPLCFIRDAFLPPCRLLGAGSHSASRCLVLVPFVPRLLAKGRLHLPPASSEPEASLNAQQRAWSPKLLALTGTGRPRAPQCRVRRARSARGCAAPAPPPCPFLVTPTGPQSTSNARARTGKGKRLEFGRHPCTPRKGVSGALFPFLAAQPFFAPPLSSAPIVCAPLLCALPLRR